MKKQVTFAESRKIRRLYQDDTRTAETNETKGALKDACMNFNSGVKANRHEATIQIPQTMTAAPFLKHAALTPAQKEYLYTIAASYSTAHVRDLITQHYMNVLHRCIPTGARITLLEDEDEDEKGLNDSLSDCLSSLSVGEWDDDTFSDL
ncbi:Protein FAM216A [Collichthys lucidus]|uniref:Protein FAM216A n=1 Tax=Collichthys lucidus TaxID=240159 RepID=A0A4U5VHF9_COLLU|nr:Protein FAM216A [Collichthys lucidus]